MLPVDLGIPSQRVMLFDEQRKASKLEVNFEFIDKVRDTARVRQAEYQRRLSRYFNKKVRPRRSSPKKSEREQDRSNRQVLTKLGGTLSDQRNGGDDLFLLGAPRWKQSPTSMECRESKEILPIEL